MFSSPWLTNRIQKMNTNAVTNDWARLKLTPQEIQEARTMWNIPQVYSDDAVESIVNQNLIADNMGKSFITLDLLQNGILIQKIVRYVLQQLHLMDKVQELEIINY